MKLYISLVIYLTILVEFGACNWRKYAQDYSDGIYDSATAELYDDYPVLEKYADTFAKFLQGLIRHPSGSKLIGSVAEVFDFFADFDWNLNFERTNAFMASAGLPPMENLIADYAEIMRRVYVDGEVYTGADDAEGDQLLSKMEETQKHISIFQSVAVRNPDFGAALFNDFGPIFATPEMTRFLSLASERSFHNLYIDFAVEVIEDTTTLLTGELEQLKSAPELGKEEL